ncbi:transcription factor 23-like isoform X2 [Dinothrombium tinctorium]|uniref:Transcription factor 23-like isoform X2 n=1 Tax=Dinothrombium tinctorium TaxID=1965070 RepID=A0A3S3P6T7_9ACAR|nr:transcription factor 23-like isoform X2 [Dinothrombium tinctorium]
MRNRRGPRIGGLLIIGGLPNGGLLPMNGCRPMKPGLRPPPNIGGLRCIPGLPYMNGALASKSDKSLKLIAKIMKRKRLNKATVETAAIKKIESEKNAERERKRVKSLKQAFDKLQKCLPSVPPDTKLSKRDILILAAHRISELSRILSEGENDSQSSDLNHENCLRHLHPIKKWPMRSRLYANGLSSTTLISQQAKENEEDIAINDAVYSYNLLNSEEWEAIDFSNYDLFNSFNFAACDQIYE